MRARRTRTPCEFDISAPAARALRAEARRRGLPVDQTLADILLATLPGLLAEVAAVGLRAAMERAFPLEVSGANAAPPPGAGPGAAQGVGVGNQAAERILSPGAVIDGASGNDRPA